MRFGDFKTATLISLFHLPHFFRRVETAEEVKIRKCFCYIANAPNNYVDYFKLQGSFGKYLIRILVYEWKEFVKVEVSKFKKILYWFFLLNFIIEF